MTTRSKKEKPLPPKANEGSRGPTRAERIAQRRATERRRERLWKVGVPLAVVLVIVVLGGLVALTASGGGTASSEADVTAGPARTTLLATGDEVPAFAAPAVDGGRVDWTEFAGEPAVLTVWAPWCPHCQEELPVLSQVASEFPDVPVVTVATAIGQHPGPSPESFMADHSIDLPTALDSTEDAISGSLGVSGFPTLLFVDADGVVHHTMTGEVAEEDLRAAMQALQGERAANDAAA